VRHVLIGRQKRKGCTVLCIVAVNTNKAEVI